MSAVCTCYNPKVERKPGKDPVCNRCGRWWNLQYGSMPEGIPNINLGLRREFAAPVRIGRNEACFCGSGKKFKKCHGGNQS